MVEEPRVELDWERHDGRHQKRSKHVDRNNLRYAATQRVLGLEGKLGSCSTSQLFKNNQEDREAWTYSWYALIAALIVGG